MTPETAENGKAIWDWLKNMQTPRLPAWSDFPDFTLYMDQVILLLNQYLYPDEDVRAVTPSMINNYIKSRIIPPSVKKKYSRYHLAGLIMICILKENVSIADIPHLLPHLDSEEGIRQAYEAFSEMYNSSSSDFMQFISDTSKNGFTKNDADPEHFVLRLAVAANLSQTLTNRLIRQTEKSAE